MKKFDNFKEAGEWIEKTIKKINVLEPITKEIYADSKEFIYLDTEDMYNSGASSPFKDGYVILKADYVKRLYYGTYKGIRNKQATPLWYIPTLTKNSAKYIKMYVDEFEKEKKK